MRNQNAAANRSGMDSLNQGCKSGKGSRAPWTPLEERLVEKDAILASAFVDLDKLGRKRSCISVVLQSTTQGDHLFLVPLVVAIFVDAVFKAEDGKPISDDLE